MGKLLDRIREAVRQERYLVTLHAGERLEERAITEWQAVLALEDATLISERPRSQPHPSVVVSERLPNGMEIEAVWAWLAQSGRAQLVTVYFPQC